MNEENIATFGFQIENGKVPKKWSCILVEKEDYEKAVKRYGNMENYHCIANKGKYIILYLE